MGWRSSCETFIIDNREFRMLQPLNALNVGMIEQVGARLKVAVCSRSL
jgi:hypothetical protein